MILLQKFNNNIYIRYVFEYIVFSKIVYYLGGEEKKISFFFFFWRKVFLQECIDENPFGSAKNL